MENTLPFKRRIVGFSALASAAVVGVAALLAAPPQAIAAPPGDWSKVPAATVKLFYPGQSAYEWLLSPEHKRADKQVADGRACTTCHEKEEADLGNLLVSGKKLEPTAIAGKNGVMDLGVQAAFDADTLYLRFRWKTNMNRPGYVHGYLRFDGEKWTAYGGPRSDKEVREAKQPPYYEDRLAIMLDDGKVPLFDKQGCWLTCHNGMADMPGEATRDQIAKHPLFGDAGTKAGDIRKYLGLTRADPRTWDKTKSAEEIAKLKADGAFLDLIQWRSYRSSPVGMADDGYVLEYRLFDEGSNPFSSNVDRATGRPRFMFDSAKVGTKALTVKDVGDFSKPYALIKEDNVVPFDPNAGWKKDDVLPGIVLGRADAKGSAADNGNVKGEWKDGFWTVTLARKLDTGHPKDDKVLKVGGVYTVGLAVHDDSATGRFHHVGFPLTLGIGAKAAIEAVKVP